MKFIEVNYQTWQREECYGMFDYSQTKNIKYHKPITIKSAGMLVRNQVTYEMEFIYNKIEEQSGLLENYTPFLRIDENQGHFFINNSFNQNGPDSLSIIVPKNEKGYKLKQKDKIKLGKANIELLSINWKKSRSKNHYEQRAMPKISEKQSIFACSFYSQKQKASMIESNPACRYCFSKTITQNNPFLFVCKCSGSAKYIHQECLIQWVKKRSGIMNENIKEGVYYANAKAFTCEVCNSFYCMDRLLKEVFNVEDQGLQEYAIFHLHGDPSYIYVVDLAKVTDIQLGRSLQSSIVINQLSVSRKHCSIKVDYQKKQLIISDLSAKFGTVIQVVLSEIQDYDDFQKGRTKMAFRKCQKLSFFEKIGFCSPRQNLKNQKSKFES